MFRGVQHINLDAKGRMAVPSRQRELLSVLGDGHIVLTVDTQTPCLYKHVFLTDAHACVSANWPPQFFDS